MDGFIHGELVYKEQMGILQDIADGKPIKDSSQIEPFADLLEQIEEGITINNANMLETKMLQERTKNRISFCDGEIARLEAAIAARKAPESPQRASENAPPVLRPTAPLNFLMNERTQKSDMEAGTWDMTITIETLEVDELVKLGDFANNVAYQNHRAHIIKSTPPDTFPGFRLRVKVGLMSVGKRVIKSCVSKEDVMYSKEFITNLVEILALMRQKSGLS